MPRVLIVEDDKYLNKLLSDRLKLAGLDIHSVLDGFSAYKALEEAAVAGEHFDFLLTDMLLPQMMGAELFTRIREDERFEKLRLLAMSGIYKDPQQIEEITALHALEAYLTKPFDVDALIAHLQGHAVESTAPQSDSGDLTDRPLERIFFQAYDRAFTGRMILRTPQAERKIYFMNGFPVSVESTAVQESLGHSLIQLGFVSSEQREAASKQMTQEKVQLGQMLIKLGALTETQLFEAMRKHTYRVLLNCFAVKEATFELEPLDSLPHHVMAIEINPMLLIFRAFSLLYSKELLFSLFEAKKDFYAHRSARFYQVLPLFNLDEQSRKLLLSFPGQTRLHELLEQVPEAAREVFLRLFYVLENLKLVEWHSKVGADPETNEVLDLKSEGDKTPEIVERAMQSLQARYVQMLNKNYFEILEIAPDAEQIAVDAAYREIRYQLHPDRYGDQLTGQAKRILDDMMARVDKAYQTLSNESTRAEYLATTAQHREDSVADSKKYLAAQDAFHAGLRLLESQKFSQAAERFANAAQTWSRGGDYEVYAHYASFRAFHSEGKTAEAAKLLQKLKEIVFHHASSDMGFVLLGHAQRALGKLDLAKEAYQKALQLNDHCDEAANALAGFGEAQLKKQRIDRAVKTSGTFVKKTLLLFICLVAFGVIYFFRDYIFYRDEKVQTLDPKAFQSIGPVLNIKYKENTAKIVVQSGWLPTVPEPVLRSKCLNFLKEVEAKGIHKLYWYDGDKGLKAYCSPERFQAYGK